MIMFNPSGGVDTLKKASEAILRVPTLACHMAFSLHNDN